MNNIAILASGSGTNAANIMGYFSNTKIAKVTLVLSNSREAYVLRRAAERNVKSFFFDHTDLYTSGKVIDTLVENDIDLIVLAGFLWLIPECILNHYNGRIVNIHPALLPKYGGKGMYGDRVHRAVIANNDKESGITIHYVNSFYDEGDIIFQAKCRVEPGDTPGTLAARIHALEYEHYPRVIEEILMKLPKRSESGKEA